MKHSLLLPALLSFVACGTEFTSDVEPPPGSIASITLSMPTNADLTSAGDTRTISVAVQDAGGGAISSAHLVWSSAQSNVATVTSEGNRATVTAVDDGTATISASSGTIRATINVRVKRRLVSIEYERSDSVMAIGSTLGLLVIGRDARGQPMHDLPDVHFSSTNGGSIIVARDGTVTALFTGFGNHTAMVIATVTRDGATYQCERLFSTLPPAPPVFHNSSYMLPQSVLPEPGWEFGEAIVFFRRESAGLKYKLYWSYLTGAPTDVHLHVSPDDDPAADILVDIPLQPTLGIHGVLDGIITAENIRAQRGRAPISMDSLTNLMGVFGTYFDMHTALHPEGEVGNLVYPFPWPPRDAAIGRQRMSSVIKSAMRH